MNKTEFEKKFLATLKQKQQSAKIAKISCAIIYALLTTTKFTNINRMSNSCRHYNISQFNPTQMTTWHKAMQWECFVVQQDC